MAKAIRKVCTVVALTSVHLDAEAVFKRLSEAYECLADEDSQRSYLQKLQQPTASRAGVRSPKPARPKYKNKRKRKAPEPPTAAQAKEPLSTKRRSTPEEVWQQFQREEEELARREFHAKGFERVYDSASKRAAKTSGADDSSAPPHTLPPTEQRDILDSNLDAKAKKWATWNKPNLTQAESPPVAATDEGGSGSVEESEAPVILICCLLCRRKFPTAEALGRHEALSKLHAANLQAQRARSSGDGP